MMDMMDINTNITTGYEVGEEERKKIDVAISNIKHFCKTPKGSIPLMRDYGIDYNAVDEPFFKAKQKICISVVGGVRKYFGINISNIDVTANEEGKLNLKIIIGG